MGIICSKHRTPALNCSFTFFLCLLLSCAPEIPITRRTQRTARTGKTVFVCDLCAFFQHQITRSCVPTYLRFSAAGVRARSFTSLASCEKIAPVVPNLLFGGGDPASTGGGLCAGLEPRIGSRH